MFFHNSLITHTSWNKSKIYNVTDQAWHVQPCLDTYKVMVYVFAQIAWVYY